MKQQKLILIPEQMKQQSLEQWTDTAKMKWKRSSPNLSEAGDPTKKGASNDDKTIGVSTTKAKVDYYPRANEAAKAEIIDIDKDDEKKANETKELQEQRQRLSIIPEQMKLQRLQQLTLTIRIQ